MKTKFYRFISLAMLLFAVASCEKDQEHEPGSPEMAVPINIPLKDAQVVIPQGSDYSLVGHSLMTFGTLVPVDQNGGTKTSDIRGAVNVAYLFDPQGQPVLAGFITDSTSVVSVETTARVLLYYASGAAFMRDTVRSVFIQRAHELSGVKDWISEFSELWKSNPRVLATGGYNQPLKARVSALFEEPEINPYTPVANGRQMANNLTDILVDNNDIRSGLQVAQRGAGQLMISNYYRRRAHAFFYKTKFKPKGADSFTVIHQSIGENTQSDRDMIVQGSSGATSMSGSVVKLISGKGMDFAVAETGPIDMQLADNEEEAVYQLHVVGVGNSGSTKTRAEREKMTRLVLETFALDFLMPMLGMAIGTLDEQQKNVYIELVEEFLKYTPETYDILNKGDFKSGIISAGEKIGTEAGNIFLQKVGEALYKKAASSLADKKNMNDYIERSKNVPVLKVADGLLQGVDWAMVTGYIIASKQMENWEVTVRMSQVRLEPKESRAAPFSQVTLEAFARNIEDSQKSKLTYKWRTSGKYGYIIDTKGNRGTNFQSVDQKIFYNCNTPASNLGNENIENVYVEVYLDGKFLGRDSTRINVQKSSYLLRPNDITLTGQKGTNATKANLYLKPAHFNVIRDIGPNDSREYKVVWSTPGAHGGFIPPQGGSPTKTVTTYDRNGIVYECTDDRTRQSTESITARVYSRDKNSPDAPFRLFDVVTGRVVIRNDPKIRIVHLPVKMMKGDAILWDKPLKDSWGNTYYTHQCYQVLGASFRQNPEDASYHIRFYSSTGATESGSWKAGDKFESFSHGDLYPAYDGSTYKIGTGMGGWGVGPYYPGQPKPTCDNNLSTTGEEICVLTITLK